ncbi:hypothetical protein GCM10010145_66670 [Streptomyces ruber]|uniref:Uncharacterized protein n=2 Tax=Streptomyces TaxID=1883 RepID=A0A918BR62_9ACTN|nr:hypothetical protein [Streptomyces ruber]GGQ87943.1 hypothetical protein GCM10010145_66670 [Streptomyces ruber]
MFEQLVAPLRLPSQSAVADDLMVLRDGAMVAGHLGEAGAAAASFLRGCRAVIRQPLD